MSISPESIETQHSTEQLQAVIDSSATGFVVLDDSNRILFANPAAGALLGTPSRLLFRTTLDVSHDAGAAPSIKQTGMGLLRFDVTQLRWHGQPARLVAITGVVDIDDATLATSTLNSKYSATTRLGELTLQGASPSELREAAAKLVCDTFDVDIGLILRYKPETKRGITAAAAIRRNDRSAVRYNRVYTSNFPTTMRTQIGYSAITAKPSTVLDWHHQTRFDYTIALSSHKIVSSATVAIPGTDDESATSWGVFGAYSTRPRTFTTSDITFLQSIANVLAQSMQRARNMARKRESDLLLQVASRTAKLGGWAAYPAEDRIVWSKEAAAIHGLPAQETTKTFAEARQFFHPDDYQRVTDALDDCLQKGAGFDEKYRNIKATGEVFWLHVIADPVYDDTGHVVSMHGAIQDITATKQAEDRIRFLALYDPLTHLPNRHHLEDQLRRCIQTNRDAGTKAAVMLLDMDNFKVLNDTVGHDSGDQLLQQVTERIEGQLRPGDFAARFGGDEFALIVNGLDENGEKAATQAKEIGAKLLVALRRPYRLDEVEHFSTQCLGITLFGFDNDDVAELLKQADMTMYYAKARGRGQLRIFDPELQATLDTQAALEGEMRQGLLRKEFCAHYQAQVDGNGAVFGAELLARWHHPQRGWVSPGQFIPVAEESGLILELGQIMLEAACTQLAEWARQPQTEHLTLAVNISVKQLYHPEFVSMVMQAVERAGANPRRLVLEVTESLLLENVDDSIEKMKMLSDYGIAFSLDDFGTGYSSLSYLKSLPLKELKIDQSFVRNVHKDANAATIVRTILALTSAMNLSVIAEGVETATERNFLAAEGCQRYQGFLFCKPQSVDDFQSYLTDSCEAHG